MQGYNIVTSIYFSVIETHISLVQTETLGSKVTRSEGQTTQKNFSFLSEINRWDLLLVEGHKCLETSPIMHCLVSHHVPVTSFLPLHPLLLSPLGDGSAL